mmetsp:Transcript_1891/g.6741  ORF Transcript_1891/g.6741 Transcript_1891/m.6741 type:complete len:759 (+) Transcript_1891:3281-5557(+)
MRSSLFLFLFLSCTLFSCRHCFFIPSHSYIEACVALNQTQSCTQETIYVEGRIDASSTLIQYKLPQQLLDQYGRPWNTESDVNLYMYLSSMGLLYQLKKKNLFLSSHEVSETWPSTTFCPSGSLCCNNERRFFKSSSDYLYQSYEILPAKFQFTIDIFAQQGTFSTVASLTKEQRHATFPGGEAFLLLDTVALNALAWFSDTWYAVTDLLSPQLKEVSLVPTAEFCRYATQTNCLGMHPDAYSNWISPQISLVCPAKNSIFSTNTNPSGWSSQLEGYNSKMSDMISQCEFDPSSSSYSSDPPRVFLSCTDIGTAQVVLKLNIAKGSFRIRPNFGNAIVLDKGLRQVLSTDQTASIFISVNNNAQHPASVILIPKELCILKKDSDTSFKCSSGSDALMTNVPLSKTLSPDQTVSFHFALSADAVRQAKGYAVFELRQTFISDQVPVMDVTVNFDLTSDEPTSDNANIGDVPGKLDCPLDLMVTKNGVVFCREPCETDDVFYDAQIDNCRSTDCVAKYRGNRNHFNSQTQLCEPIVQCLSNEVYNSIDNVCEVNQINPGSTDTLQPEDVDSQDAASPMQPKNEYTEKNFESEDPGNSTITGAGIGNTEIFGIPISCNGHGRVEGNTCVCDEGFGNPRNVDIFSFCTVQGKGTNGTGSASTSAAALVGSLFSGDAQSLIQWTAIGVVLVVMCGLSICSCACVFLACDFVRRRRKRTPHGHLGKRSNRMRGKNRIRMYSSDSETGTSSNESASETDEPVQHR